MTLEQYDARLAEAEARLEEEVWDGTFASSRQQLANQDFFWLRAWALASSKSASKLSHSYRKFELNPEADIATACRRYDEGLPPDPIVSEIAQAMRRHELRYFWRYLLGRHAHQSARAADHAFALLGEPWYWRLWRLKDLLYPRLFLGIFGGFLLIYTSSELWGFLTFLERHWLRDWLRGAASIATFLLAIAEVQRRVGRLDVGLILRRAWTLTWVSFVYGALGAVLQFQMGEHLGGWGGGSYAHGAGIAANTMFLAVMLGMVTQLFGREESLGEPL
ncbi:MAG: hypothetical protein K2X03_01525 [Bryobacteraceae bacterium]|nr:hypothetical protein [Bryobacteraceae bacterium]